MLSSFGSSLNGLVDRISSRIAPSVFSIVLVGIALSMIGWQIHLGLCENEVFHITGLYPNLRSETFIPDISRWNFRPVGYKAILALLSVGPLNGVGWTERFAPFFIILSSVAVLSTLFLVANGRKVTDPKAALRLAVLSALVLGQPGNHPWSADAFAGYLALAGLLIVHRGFAVTRLAPFVLALALGTGLYLLKGASVVLALPVFCLMGEKLGWGRAVKNFICATVVGVLLVSGASPETTHMLLESAVLQDSRFFPHPLGALHLFTRHFSPLFVVGVAIVLISDGLRRSRRGWQHLVVPASTVLSAIVFHGVQGKSWSYHLAPAYSFAAFLLLQQIDLLDTLRDLPRWSLALITSLLLGAPLSQARRTDYRIGLANIAGLTSASEVLYLAYGSRGYARFGYPPACQMMSPHLIQRAAFTRVTSDARLKRSAQLLQCASDYAGPLIVYEPKWMGLKAHGYDDLLRHLEQDFRKAEAQNLPRGIRLLRPTSAD